jgi:hypothetical protein
MRNRGLWYRRSPRARGRRTLPPLAALFALLAGLEVAGILGGILGGLFAVPIAGVLWVLAADAYRHFVSAEPRTELASEALPEAAGGPNATNGSDATGGTDGLGD